MKIQVFFPFLLVVLFLSSAFSQTAFTKWRGPDGNGIYPDKNLLQKWPEAGPEIVWTFDDLGIGSEQ